MFDNVCGMWKPVKKCILFKKASARAKFLPSLKIIYTFRYSCHAPPKAQVFLRPCV